MPYWKRAGSPNYYGRVWDPLAGAYTKDKSLKVRDERAADAACRQWERDLADPAGTAAKRFTVKEALDGFGKHLTTLHARGETSAATVRYHAGKAAPLQRIIGADALLSKISPQVVEAYKTARLAEKVTLHSATKELRTLRYAMRIAKLNQKYSGDLEAVFPRMTTGYKPRTRSLTEGELLALLWCAQPDTGAQIAFAVATSAESKCLVSARREDISPDLRFVHLRGTKRVTRLRTVPMVTELQRQLIAYASENAKGEEGMLFSGGRWGLNSNLAALSKRLGMPHLSTNDLRRTFAVLLREAGAPIELIAPMMGHIDTTMVQRVYGRLSPQALADRLSTALNIGAESSAGDPQQGSSGIIQTHSTAEFLSKMEPTAGVEPATYGLRSQMLIVNSAVNPPTWRLEA